MLRRILVYKRTHDGDPDHNGRFGVSDCMGSVRNLSYDAVLGVGGIGAEARRNGLAGIVNWIGIGPHKKTAHNKKGPVVTFDHFPDVRSKRLLLEDQAPELAKRIYGKNVRWTIIRADASMAEYNELRRILRKAQHAPSSLARTTGNTKTCGTGQEATRRIVCPPLKDPRDSGQYPCRS